MRRPGNLSDLSDTWFGGNKGNKSLPPTAPSGVKERRGKSRRSFPPPPLPALRPLPLPALRPLPAPAPPPGPSWPTEQPGAPATVQTASRTQLYQQYQTDSQGFNLHRLAIELGRLHPQSEWDAQIARRLRYGSGGLVLTAAQRNAVITQATWEASRFN